MKLSHRIKNRIIRWLDLDAHRSDIIQQDRYIRKLELDVVDLYAGLKLLQKQIDGFDMDFLKTRLANRPTRQTVERMVKEDFNRLDDQLAFLQSEAKNLRDQAEYAIANHQHDRKYPQKEAITKQLADFERRMKIVEGILHYDRKI